MRSIKASIVICTLGFSLIAGCGDDDDDALVDASMRDAARDGATPDGSTVIADAAIDARPGDTTPPAMVTTLAAGTPAGGALALTFTAVGDDGNTGMATSYDVRYRSGGGCPLTVAGFATATAVTGEPTPGAPGSTETVNITGLVAATHYCFGVIVRDESNNASALSNVVSLTLAGTSNEQITALRAAIAGGGAITAMPSLTITGAIVSYIKPLIGTAAVGSSEGPGFFIQNADTGPALFFAVDPATFIAGGPVAVGDRLDLTSTEGRWLSCSTMTAPTCSTDVSMHVVTAATGTRSATAQAIPPVQDLTAVAITVPIGTAPWTYENELIRITAAIPVGQAFVTSGAAYQSVQITTTGNPTPNAGLVLRLPNSLIIAKSVIPGCTIAIDGAPMWRFSTAAQVSAWRASELTVSGCPTTAVVSTNPPDAATGVAHSAPISITFNAPMDATTLTAQLEPGPCSGSVRVSTDDFATCIGFMSAIPTLSSNDTTASFTPAPALSFGASYKIRVMGTAAANGARPLAGTFTTATGFVTGLQPGSCDGSLVLSQVYGGGGNSGATYTHDFIEIHNRGATPVSLNGKSVQYSGATGTTWQVTALPDVMLGAGEYFLIQEAMGVGGTTALPSPDVIGTIPMGGTNGKVLLANSATALTGSCPTTNVIDLLGYGTSDCRELTATAALSNTTSAQRNAAGCQDTNVNLSDFTLAAPAPRSKAGATAMPCACAVIERTMNETGVTGEADMCRIDGPSSLTVAPGGMGTVNGSIREAGVTSATGVVSSIIAQVGVGPIGANPENQPGWTWFAASYSGDNASNEDSYIGAVTAPASGTRYRYAYRFSLDGTSWTYCDSNAAGSEAGLTFEVTQLPTLTLN